MVCKLKFIGELDGRLRCAAPTRNLIECRRGRTPGRPVENAQMPMDLLDFVIKQPPSKAFPPMGGRWRGEAVTDEGFRRNLSILF